jgi:hypothetical protein
MAHNETDLYFIDRMYHAGRRSNIVRANCDLNMKDATLKKVFAALKKQSGYEFCTMPIC